MSSLNKGTYVEKNKITVYELGVEINENKFKRNKITQATYYRNIQTLNIIKNSRIKNIKIQKITSCQIQDFMDSTISYANASIEKISIILNGIFKEALKRDYIIKNPMINVERPKSEKLDKKVEALSIDEQRIFLNALNNETVYKNIFIIALYTGMRFGEILALKKDDIDFKNKVINISRSLTINTKGKTILGDTTKTYNSVRTIPITSLVEASLKNAISNMVLNVNNLIFVQPNGKLYAVSNLNSRFKRICCNAGLGSTTYIIKRKNKGTGEIKKVHSQTSNFNQHMLRHTYATRCIESGMPAEVLHLLFFIGSF